MASRLMRTLEAEVEVLEGLAGRKAGRFDAGFAAVVLAGRDFALEAGGEELFVAPAFGAGPLAEAIDRGGQCSVP